jgi:hypothetical protein
MIFSEYNFFSDKMLSHLFNFTSKLGVKYTLPSEIQNKIRDYFLTNKYILIKLNNYIIYENLIFPSIVTCSNLPFICRQIVNSSKKLKDNNLLTVACAYLQTIGDHKDFTKSEFLEAISKEGVISVQKSRHRRPKFLTLQKCITYLHGDDWWDRYLKNGLFCSESHKPRNAYYFHDEELNPIVDPEYFITLSELS